MAFVYESKKISIFDKKIEDKSINDNLQIENNDIEKKKIIKYFFIKKKAYNLNKEKEETIDDFELKNMYLPKKIKNNNPSYAFNSQLNRSNLFKINNELGPGEYNIPNSFDKYKNKIKNTNFKPKTISYKQDDEKIKFYLAHNLKYDNKKGYSIPKANRLVKEKSIENNKISEEKWTNYSVNNSLISTNLNSKKNYNINKPSSFFISKTQRDAFNLNFYQNNNKLNKEFIKDATPGPGFYEFIDKNKIKTKPKKFQIFNTGVDRFKASKLEKKPEPGQYFKDKSFNISTFNKKIDKIYGNNTEKNNALAKSLEYKKQIPGPGTYNNIDYFKEILKDIKNKEIFKNLISKNNKKILIKKKFMEKIKELIIVEKHAIKENYIKKRNNLNYRPIKKEKRKYKKNEDYEMFKLILNKLNEIENKSKMSTKPSNIQNLKFNTKNFIKNKNKKKETKNDDNGCLVSLLQNNFKYDNIEKKIKKKVNKSNIEPFNSRENRFKDYKENNKQIGPGVYYNKIDWNIESFNIKYN